MQKIFWSNLNKGFCRLATGAVLMAAPVAESAQAEQAPAVPLCTLIATPVGMQSAAVRDSWPRVLKNAFGADGKVDAQLSLTLMIPVSRGGAAPCLADYFVERLHMSPDGVVTGAIVPTSRDYPMFVYDPVIVDPEMIIDWRFAPNGVQLAFGGYTTRASLKNPTDAQLAELGLQPQYIPPDWD